MLDKEKLMRKVRTWGFALIALGVALSCSIEPAPAQQMPQQPRSDAPEDHGQDYYLILTGRFTLPNGQPIESSIHLRVPSKDVCDMMLEWPHTYLSLTPYQDAAGGKMCISAHEYNAALIERAA